MSHKKSHRFSGLILALIFMATISISKPILAAQAVSPASGDFLWAKGMGGTSFDVGESIALDSSGNVYTTGIFWDTADFDPGAGTADLTSVGEGDIFVSKLDSSGNFVWAIHMGGTSDDFGKSITLDSSGNIYTVGSFRGTADFDPGAGIANLTSAGMYDIFISKLDSGGNFVWAKRMGGTSFDGGKSIALDSSGNIYTTGFFDDTVDFDPGASTANLTSAGVDDIFISKLDSSGNFVWAKRMGGTGEDFGRSITLDSSGNIYTMGDFRGTADFNPGAGTSNLTSAAAADIFISKLDGSGNFIWAKRMGGTDYDIGRDITLDSSGNIFTTGYFVGTADFDPGAGTANLTSAGTDIFVSKLDSGGNFVWAKRMGGTSHDFGMSITLDSSGNIYTTGGFNGIADFDPGAGTANLTSAGKLDIFVSKLNSNGDFVWAKGMGGTSDDTVHESALDSNGNIYTTGIFQNTADFDPGAGAFELTSAGENDIFVFKLENVVPPIVTSIVCANANPTNETNVDFTVTFSKPVTGVDVSDPFSDFVLATTGVTGASITNVTGSDTTYTVIVNTGVGNGTIRLDVVDDDSILDAVNNPLGGVGVGNGDFITGKKYTIVKPKPGIPVLLSPANGALVNTLQPTLDWKDSVPTAHEYQVQVSANNTFIALVVSETNILASDFTPSSDLDPGKRYYWRVNAFSAVGGVSGWSTIWNFRTPLAKPILVSPTDGSSLPTDRPDLDWEDVNGATNYIVQVSPSMSFGTLLVNKTLNQSAYGLPTDLPQNKLLYWRVRAKNPVVTGPWSDKWSFTTGNPPSVPTLVSPANNALVKDYTPKLDWSNSTLPAGTTFQHYELQVDDNSDFSSPEINISTTDGVITESSFTPLIDLAFNTKYYWRVRAVNDVAGVDHFSAWSAVRYFRAAMLPPTLLLPAHMSTAATLNPLFEWQAVIGATSYTLQISTSPSFGTFLVNKNTTLLTFTPSTNLPKNKIIYWRVRANGPNGPSNWSTFQFTTPP